MFHGKKTTTRQARFSFGNTLENQGMQGRTERQRYRGCLRSERPDGVPGMVADVQAAKDQGATMNTQTEIRIYKTRKDYVKRRIMRDWVKFTLFIVAIGLSGYLSVWMGVRP